MKKFSLMMVLMAGLFAVSACSNGEKTTTDEADKKLQVVATNSIIGDMVENIAGDLVDLHNIVPVGTDPHEYEPLPEDIEKATTAQVVFYNGLNLETGGNGWFSKLMETSNKEEGKDYFSVSQGVTPLYLTSTGQESEQDPHAWLDIENGIQYVKNITTVLADKDEKNRETYEKNADAYIEKLSKLDASAKEKFKDIPKEKKLLVTSEGAFKYFSKAYDLDAAYIWEINTENQGTPSQMSAIVDKVRTSKVPVLFVETSVDKRSMESVAKETNLPIYEEIFTDSIGKKGENGDSYYNMMEWNLTQIYDGLSK
ncbi:metal ABC transporter substrate-binding protein [Isobaculum melis]|uniref:Iron/zinc/copper transport system substrate-binding protein n=1 Tax=Isobaculum melis TaxID=142588 RepID=A0A1H9R6B2_9LACT|nr:metal ABC transporter substrate-binding protein [Isobaculum melis]SER67589.1 iron/zinc/copper transport system substrate-binding protein [Isobaculum melis]